VYAGGARVSRNDELSTPAVCPYRFAIGETNFSEARTKSDGRAVIVGRISNSVSPDRRRRERARC